MGAVEANVPGIVSSVSTTVSFELENTPGAVTTYVSGGTVRHLGWASQPVDTSNVVFNTGDDFTIKCRFESLSAGATAKLQLYDAVDIALLTSLPALTFHAAGAISMANADCVLSRRAYELPDLRIGTANTSLRAKLYISGVGNSCVFSSWIES